MTDATNTCMCCGAALPPNRNPGNPRKWCSERCRRVGNYAGTCEVCGAPTDGSNGRERAPKRCSRHQGEVISARMTATHGETRERVAQMWRDGATIEEVKDALGYTSVKAARTYLHRLRHWYGIDLPDSRKEPNRTCRAAPPELFNQDGIIIATRIDGPQDTRGKAAAFFASEWGVPFSAIRPRRTAYRENTQYAEEAKADGIEEPYDGWPWQECKDDEPGAHPFWAFNDGDFA